ncbi:hypothetical protein ACHAXS_005527 [Conticribra weissflogii]
MSFGPITTKNIVVDNNNYFDRYRGTVVPGKQGVHIKQTISRCAVIFTRATSPIHMTVDRFRLINSIAKDFNWSKTNHAHPISCT